MLTYDLEERGQKPIYEYLYGKIREDIRIGEIRPMEKLPSKRRLAEHLGISVITVQNAYEQLLAEGYIVSRERGGYFAADLGESVVEAMPREKRNLVKSVSDREDAEIDLTSLSPDPSLFPFSVWSRLVRRVLAEQDKKLLERVPAIGVEELRRAISDHLWRTRGLAADPECIVIGAGTEYLYNLLLQLLGRGRVFAIENPGYRKLAQILARCEVPYIPVDLDECGMKPDVSGADVIHVSPSHHFPTGIVMPAPRRRELLKAADAAGGYIIEDDYDSEFRFEGRMPQTLFSEDVAERVIYINTFAETISPSLRISYMILPSDLMKKFRKEMSFYSCTVPSFEQYTLAAFLSESYFEKHVNRMRLSFKQKRSEIVQAARGFSCLSVDSPAIGMNLLFRFSSEKSDAEIKRELLRRGVKMNFVSDYLYRENGKYNGMAIVNFARADKESILKGAEILESVAFCGN